MFSKIIKERKDKFVSIDILKILREENDINELRKHMLCFARYTMSSLDKQNLWKFLLNNINFSGIIPKSKKPKVSIIIPVKNEVLLTKIVLNSIIKHTTNIEYEVIIANDSSTDETNMLDKLFANLRIVDNNTGETGFIYNVSNAINYAKGEFILLLNNDMIVCENYLTELLNVMKYDGIGIAGAKTLTINNTIAECGIKMNSDGIVEFLYANMPVNTNDNFEYIECDYCSGCSILFRKKIWDIAGGFDKNFAPAYYEDSDFAFNLKYNLGLKTVVVPKSKIFHFKRQTYEKYDTVDIRKNKAYFLNKWKHVLNS